MVYSRVWQVLFIWRKRRVRLHLKDAVPSIEGVLLERPAAFYVLGAATVVSPEGTVSSDGTTWVPRENVLFLQEIS